MWLAEGDVDFIEPITIIDDEFSSHADADADADCGISIIFRQGGSPFY